MPLLPPLKAMFEAQRNAPLMPTDLPPSQLREAMHAMIEQSFYAFSTPQAPAAVERDFAVAVTGGKIDLRVYRVVDDEQMLPCHIYYHGGGFFLGTLEHSDGLCRSLARQVGCVVVSVDYRLAPEHRFPTAAEDAYGALCWVAAHAAELQIDPSRISLGGGSAGGNLAAFTSALCQAEGVSSLTLSGDVREDICVTG
jgi:acetyl esterase